MAARAPSLRKSFNGDAKLHPLQEGLEDWNEEDSSRQKAGRPRQWADPPAGGQALHSE